MSFEARFEKIIRLSQAIPALKDRFIALAAGDLKFTAKDTAHEVDLTVDRLQLFAEARESLENRQPLGGAGSWVSLMLSYNGSAWLNTVIASCYLVGNRVRVKFSSRATQLRALLESIYRPIFGADIVFYQGRGQNFMEESLAQPEISTVVVFGFDAHTLPYQDAFENSGKKLVFEGPGADPFIVFADADLDLALNDLMMAKFMYAGQTCTAPKRIFIQQAIYEEFLSRLVARVRRLKTGEPDDPETDISPVGSDLAVARIKLYLAEAVQKGARVLTGGKIEGNLVYPTVLRDAADEMQGMREEVFGPVAFTTSFASREEVLARARRHKYGLRASVFGGEEARRTAQELKGEDYCHPVPDYTFGKFGTVSLNEPRSVSWRGALVVKPAGGYGYSGWIWETLEGRFRIKQGPKLISLETSTPEN
jgi:betaine-aldehyde dehydrogenase